jgi:hypothetical protein
MNFLIEKYQISTINFISSSNEISTTIKTQMDKSDSTIIPTDITKGSAKKTASSIQESVNTSSDESEITTEEFVE